MLDHVLTVFKDELSGYLHEKAGRGPDDSTEAAVVFPDGDKMDPIVFPLGAITALIVGIEEETTLRPPDPYRVAGTLLQVHPEIRLNLHILFVARYKKYEDGLRYLSRVIQFFQRHRRLDHENTPALSKEINHLSVELVTLPFSEQNEIWNALRATYHPSVLYKVRMVVFRDEMATELDPVKTVDASVEPSLKNKDKTVSPPEAST